MEHDSGTDRPISQDALPATDSAPGGPTATDEIVAAINRRQGFWSDVPLTRSRLLSLCLALLYLVTAGLALGTTGLLRVTGFLILPMACIWFGEAMGQMVSGRITKPTPGVIVTIGGWVLLVSPLIAGVAAAIVASCPAR